MTKKYILKPGKHQFVPGTAAIHSNENLSDEEAQWYLQRYPHIASLFVSLPTTTTALNRPKQKKLTAKKIAFPVGESQNYENISPTN